MIIDTSSITPPMWEGELTEDKLNMIVAGLLNPSPELARRLACELLKSMRVAGVKGDWEDE